MNVCVYSLSKKSSLLPWTIVSVSDDQQSFSDFFRSNIQPRLAGSSETSYDVESAQVGPCKDRLDKVDLELQVCQVVESFGRYLKYVVTSQCEECNMWRLVYSKHKLNRSQRTQLQQVLDDYTYTCGAKLEDLNLGDTFKEVEVRDHLCGDPIEKLYYSAGFEPICVYCARDQTFTCADPYPQCPFFSHRPAVNK